MSDEKPAPIWLFHPPSGQLQQVSAATWDGIQAHLATGDPNVEGPWHRWVPATPDQAAMGEQIKAARLAESAPAPDPAPAAEPARRAR